MLPDSPRGLLATDLDGTLAVDDVICDDDLAAADNLRSAGIGVLVITGRNRYSLRAVGRLWDAADEVLFSSGAGLLEGPEGAGVERARLSGGDVECISGILDDAGEDYCVLDPVPLNHYFRWKVHRRRGENPDFDARMEVYAEWGRPAGDGGGCAGDAGGAGQVLVIRPPGEAPGLGLLDALSEWSVVFGTSPLDGESSWMEIFPRGLNKGSALERRCMEKGIARERVLVLGNDYNDCAMLEWGSRGRVVAGAPEALRAAFPVLPPAGRGGFAAAADEAVRLFA